jgi:hypothetical protein
MLSQDHRKKRSYSSVYKIYRRLRFIRYKRRALKQMRRFVDLQEKAERLQKIREIREYKARQKLSRQLKDKAERIEARRLKDELKEEFRQRETLAKQDLEKLYIEDKHKARKVRKGERETRRKMFYQSLKQGFKNFFLSYRSLSIRSIKSKFKDFRENAPNRKRFSIIVFNSTVLFLLSYFCLFFISQAMTVFAGSLFNYPSTVYYYQIFFNVPPGAWFHDSVRTIYSAGPLVNFIVGAVFLIIYSNIRESTAPFKLFFLWGFLHGVNMLFGAMLVGTLFETGVGHVISWLYIMDTGRVLYSIVSIFLLVIAGLMSTRPFLFSGNTYYNEINRYNRTSFIFSQVLFPYIAGNIFLIFIRQPRFIFYDTFIALTLIISIIPVLATYRTFNELYFEEGEKKLPIAWKAALILAGIVLLFRVVLGFGIRFGG